MVLFIYMAYNINYLDDTSDCRSYFGTVINKNCSLLQIDMCIMKNENHC